MSMVFVLTSGLILAMLSTGAQAQSSFRFVSWADTKSARDELSELSDQAALLTPELTIYQGDLESSGFTLSGMNAWKEAMDGQLTGNTAPNGMFDITFPVRGNHDDSNTGGWQDYFEFQATADFVGATNYTNMSGEEDLTYSFDYENAHFIGVDVTGSASAITSVQVAWIDDDLTSAESRGLTHAFIYFHGPIYCVDGHCSCRQRVCSISSSVENLIEVFNRHPIVSATFHGHEHTYAHTYIDETRIPADGAFEGVTHAFHQFVTGSAGAGPRSCDPALRCDYSMPENGFVTVDVNGPIVTVTFYRRGSMDPVNIVSFINEGGGSPIPPTANDDSASTPADTPITIDVAANDTDPNGNLDPTSANTACAGCAEPANGGLFNNGDGSFGYTPDPGFTGADGFVYEICDTLGACDTATVSITVNPSAPVTIEVRVSSSSDDAEERSSGKMYLNSSDLKLVFDGGWDQTVGMRFNGVDIPQGATIANAYVQFQVDETRPADPTYLTIQGEKVDHAATFISSNRNISSRARTKEAVSWSPVPWTRKGEAGPDQQTPNIAAVIQEIVNRSGWANGNSLVIIITGTGERVAESYNGVAAAAPLLHVEYTTGPPNAWPVANDDGASTAEGTPVTIDFELAGASASFGPCCLSVAADAVYSR